MSIADEQRLPGDLPLWEVPGWRDRFGIVAGITGRGNPALPPFDLGLWTSQPVGEVMSRWRRLASAFPGFRSMTMAHQVHGDHVLWHDGAEPGWTIAEGADGHATTSSGLLLLVTVADCIPVYVAAPRQRAVALLHAGWRGTAARILERGVEVLCSRVGAKPADLVMHAGVGISGPSYEVGSEVMRGVGEPAEGAGPWRLDLRDVLTRQGRQLGMTEISVSSHCTARQPTDFFSHRASGGADGRMVAFLGIPL